MENEVQYTLKSTANTTQLGHFHPELPLVVETNTSLIESTWCSPHPEWTFHQISQQKSRTNCLLNNSVSLHDGGTV